MSEGVILVDPDGGVTWANAAALAMHEATRLEDLGATVAEYRARFRLRYRNNLPLGNGGYPIERLAAGEAFDDVVVEVARADEEEAQWVHRVRGLVLTADADGPAGLALVIHDGTARVEAEERFESMFNANPAPAIICRVSDLRYVKVNRGFLEMTGHLRENIIGRSSYEIDVLAGAEGRELAVERLREGRTIPQMETTLCLPGGGTKLAVVAGQPIEVGDENCMLFTFADLEPRKKAEDALRQSEERFAKAFRLTPVPTIIGTLEGFKILDVNDAFVASTGYAVEEVVGRDTAELRLWHDPAVRERYEADLLKAGVAHNVEARLRNKAGDLIDCLVSAETVNIHGRSCVLCVLQDITERNRSQAELVEAIEEVMRDASWFSRMIIEKMADARRPSREGEPDGAGLATLTRREQAVLNALSRGMSDAEIASDLGVSRHTVRNHLTAVYRKIGVRRRSAAVVWARERGVTGEPEGKRRSGEK